MISNCQQCKYYNHDRPAWDSLSCAVQPAYSAMFDRFHGGDYGQSPIEPCGDFERPLESKRDAAMLERFLSIREGDRSMSSEEIEWLRQQLQLRRELRCADIRVIAATETLENIRTYRELVDYCDREISRAAMETTGGERLGWECLSRLNSF